MYDGQCRCGRPLTDDGLCWHCDGGGLSPRSLDNYLTAHEKKGMKVTRIRDAAIPRRKRGEPCRMN